MRWLPAIFFAVEGKKFCMGEGNGFLFIGVEEEDSRMPLLRMKRNRQRQPQVLDSDVRRCANIFGQETRCQGWEERTDNGKFRSKSNGESRSLRDDKQERQATDDARGAANFVKRLQFNGAGLRLRAPRVEE
jgi:hypothetical protein